MYVGVRSNNGLKGKDDGGEGGSLSSSRGA